METLIREVRDEIVDLLRKDIGGSIVWEENNKEVNENPMVNLIIIRDCIKAIRLAIKSKEVK